MSDDFSPDTSEFRCLVPFPDQSASFVHGFEAGMIWQRMNAGEQTIGSDLEIATHSCNLEVFQRMADTHGYLLEIDYCDDDEWMIATFSKNHQRFRVVK